MKFTKLKKVEYDYTKVGKPDCLILNMALPSLTLKSHRRLSQINKVIPANREKLLGILRDGGAGFYAREVMKPKGVEDEVYQALVGKKAPDQFDYTHVEIKPIHLSAALQIALMFGWDTNFDRATFEQELDDGTLRDYIVASPERFVEIFAQLEGK